MKKPSTKASVDMLKNGGQLAVSDSCDLPTPVRVGKKARFFRSIQWRLIFILSMITFVLMTIVWVFLNFQVERSFYESFKYEISRNYESLDIRETVTLLELESRLRTDLVIAGLILGEDKSFTLLDLASGDIYYSSDPVYQETALRPAFRAALFQSVNLLSVMAGEVEGGQRVVTRTRMRALEDFYDYVRVQPTADGEIVLFFKYSREAALDVLDRFNSMIFYSIGLALIAALGIGLAMSRTITRPIMDIMHKAELITTGEFGQMLEVKSTDEIGNLTRTFNFMSTRLNDMLTEIAAEKRKVETVINHMSDGVLSFDRTGQALHVNHAASEMLGTLSKNHSKNDQTLRFEDLVKKLGIQVTMADFTRTETVKPLVVPIRDRFVRFQFATFRDETGRLGGVIIVLQDITEEHRLENMRREFVANVSHELRTPLTSVKSYTETLLDGAMHDPEITTRFLHVINEETDRMVRLVRDLLLLSQHDSGLALTLTPVSPEALIRICLERLRHVAVEKQQKLEFSTSAGWSSDIQVNGDRDRLEQLLLNIVGNAIKYTPQGGNVHVSVDKKGGEMAIHVQDSGIGIPKQDLNRVFERFYRVDKARSRQLGGTGLGLAIAKEIAHAHGGSIHAESEINRGTRITVRLPVWKAGQDS